MSHPTSVWAHDFGIPDPAVPASEVSTAEPRALHGVAERGRSVAAALRDGSRLVRQAAAVLTEGWSAPAATTAARMLAQSADNAADVCDGNAAAIDEGAAALDRAQQAIQRAYASADARIAAEGIDGHITPILSLADADLARRRVEVVLALGAAVSDVTDDARAAAGRLSATIGPDPRPPGAVAPTPPNRTGDSAQTDAHNRALLSADLHSASPARRAFAAKVQQALAHGATIATGAPVELLAYDPDRPPGQGGAAIAVGHVSTADSVAVLVTGITTSPSAMSGPLDSAAALTKATADAAPGTTAATVLWMGYDIPLSWGDDPSGSPWHAAADTLSAADSIAAAAGGTDLAEFCTRLRQQMGPAAGLTLVGHSYGSIVVSQAALHLQRSDGIDDLVLLASPGVGPGVSQAADYPAVSADHVYALAMPADLVTHWETDALATPLAELHGLLRLGALPLVLRPPVPTHSPFGADPTSTSYGAQVIDVPSNIPIPPNPYLMGAAIGGGFLGQELAEIVRGAANLDQHSMGNYLGGAALTAVGAVVAGKYGAVPVRPGG